MKDSLRQLKRKICKVDTVQFILSTLLLGGIIILGVASIVDSLMWLKIVWLD